MKSNQKPSTVSLAEYNAIIRENSLLRSGYERCWEEVYRLKLQANGAMQPLAQFLRSLPALPVLPNPPGFTPQSLKRTRTATDKQNMEMFRSAFHHALHYIRSMEMTQNDWLYEYVKWLENVPLIRLEMIQTLRCFEPDPAIIPTRTLEPSEAENQGNCEINFETIHPSLANPVPKVSPPKRKGTVRSTRKRK